jgi:hypothetical protein
MQQLCTKDAACAHHHMVWSKTLLVEGNVDEMSCS